MRYYKQPCIDLIKLHDGDIQTAGTLTDLLSVSTDNDLTFDWLVGTGSDTQTLIPLKGRAQ